MEKIEIKDFAGIKDISIEVKQINILIGPQASGKSIIAKLLYYFKNFVVEILNAALNSKTKRDLDETYKQIFYDFFPPSSWGIDNFRMKYSINQEYIEIYRNKNNHEDQIQIGLNYSDFYDKNFLLLNDFIRQQETKNLEQEMQISLRAQVRFDYEIRKSFLFLISNNLEKNAAFSQLYIPAGRSFFANLKSSIFTFLSKNNSVDPFLIDFGTYYEQIKTPFRRNILNKSKNSNLKLFSEISFLIFNIVRGKYLQKDGEDYLELDDNRLINIANSSSGQQETLPLSIILENLAFSNPEIGGESVYIEEPEAHIFPAAQKNIVELISTVYNARKDSLQFFITTHSPYILTAFNNLLQAGILSIDATEKKIEQISNLVPKTRFLKPGEVAVYSLENGYCQSIIDEETGLIDAKIIDEVSNELAIQFDELLELEE